MTDYDETALDIDDDDECCMRCHGQGYYHDCFDDTCCCAYPESQDLVSCPDCNGTGIA